MPAALIRAVLPYLVVAMLAAGAAWWVRGVFADRAMVTYRTTVDDEFQRQMKLKEETEAADKKNTAESTVRVDAVEVKQEETVRYVTREVIRYVESKPASCPLPADWVCITNAALGFPCE